MTQPPVSRGKAWTLVVLSAGFVLLGCFVMVVVGDMGAGLGATIFFGAGLVVGIVQLVSLNRGGTGQPSGPAGLLAMAAASFVLAVSCLVLGLLPFVSPDSLASWRSPLLGVVMGAVGTVFFGGGSGLLAVKAVGLMLRR